MSVQTCFKVVSWEEANAKVAEIERTLGLPSYFGSGNPVYKPHMVVTYKDALSGEGSGYNIKVKPQGDGYMTPAEWYDVFIR